MRRGVVPGNVSKPCRVGGGGGPKNVATKVINAPAVHEGVHNFQQSRVPLWYRSDTACLGMSSSAALAVLWAHGTAAAVSGAVSNSTLPQRDTSHVLCVVLGARMPLASSGLVSRRAGGCIMAAGSWELATHPRAGTPGCSAQSVHIVRIAF